MLGNRLQFQKCGVIETPGSRSMPQRLALLHRELLQLLHSHAPDETAVEQLFFAKNVKTAIDVGQARGVILLTCEEAGLPVAEYKPSVIKQAVSGYGAAGKTQVERMVKVLLALKSAPRLDDATDALAAAICHAHCRGLQAAVRTGSAGKADAKLPRSSA